MNNTNAIAGSLTRHTLTAGGVAGLVSAQDDLLRLLSLIITTIGLVWSIYEKIRRPQAPPPGGNGAATLLLLAGSALAWTGCAHFTTTQTDTSYEQGKPSRTITTRAKATTFFDSKSALSSFRASQTDKTQSATVGSLTQESSGTNVVNMFEAVARGVAAGLKP